MSKIRGPKPVATSLKRLRGNPGKRAYNHDEPLPPVPDSVKAIPPPLALGKIARKEWDRVVPILLTLHMITELDLSMLAAYCHSFQQWVESGQKITELGYVSIGLKGGVSVNPYVWINSSAQKSMIQAAQELGLSPVQRSRMKIEKPKEKSGAQEFIEGK